MLLGASHLSYHVLFPGGFKCHSGTYELPYKRNMQLLYPCVSNSSAEISHMNVDLIMLACKFISLSLYKVVEFMESHHA